MTEKLMEYIRAGVGVDLLPLAESDGRFGGGLVGVSASRGCIKLTKKIPASELEDGGGAELVGRTAEEMARMVLSAAGG